MHCLSITYKRTPLNVREQLAFTLENKLYFENQLVDKVVKGCIVISTCNRTEIYFSGDKSSIYGVENSIVKEKKISQKNLKRYIHTYSNDEAIRHLCHVVCGIDSMIVGEDEILRQIKEAYMESLVNKTTNDELNIIFQGAIGVAKTVKANTKISSTPVSIGTLTANETMKFISNKKTGNVLIVGARGKTGNLIVKNLSGREEIKIMGTTRNHLWEFADKNMKWIPYGERYQAISWADVVISATTSPHYVFTGEKIRKVLEKNKDDKLFIDLAVPSDIDKDIGSLSRIRILDIDDFEHLSKENNQIKLKEIERATVLIEDKIEEIRKAVYYHSFWENIGELEKVISKKGFAFVLYKLKKMLTADEISALLKSLRLMVKEEG